MIKHKRHIRQAFTLVEIMIVCICIALLVGPIFVLLRSGSNSSLKGMMRIDTTLKARTILHQVYADLKMACFELPLKSVKYNINDVLTRKYNSPEDIRFEFYSFPIHQKYNDIFEEASNDVGTTMAYRNVNKITYIVSAKSGSPIKTLKREVEFNNKKVTHTLSENVNFFDITKKEFLINGKTQYYYYITLQLIDVVNAKAEEKITGEKLKSGEREIILADFYDVV